MRTRGSLRITVMLEPDVDKHLRRLAREKKSTLSQAANQVLRAAFRLSARRAIR
jgi:predicted transcriptional regulator